MAKDQVQFIKEELGELIKELDLVEKKVYDTQLKNAKNQSNLIYDVLVNKNTFKIEDLLSQLAKKYAVKSELNPEPMLPEIKKFPLKYCLQNAIIPIGESETEIEFGICIPNSLNVLKNLSIMIGKKNSAKFIPPDYIFEAILQKHIHTKVNVTKSDLIEDEKIETTDNDQPKKIELELEEAEDNLGYKKDEEIELKVPETEPPIIELNLPDEENKVIEKKEPNEVKEEIEKETEQIVADITGDVVSVVDKMLSEAVIDGTSDVHIEKFKDFAQIRFRNGGTLLAQSQYKSFIEKNYNAVIARIKILANLDIAERRLPQDGKISYIANDDTEVDFRISILPTSFDILFYYLVYFQQSLVYCCFKNIENFIANVIDS